MFVFKIILQFTDYFPTAKYFSKKIYKKENPPFLGGYQPNKMKIDSMRKGQHKYNKNILSNNIHPFRNCSS